MSSSSEEVYDYDHGTRSPKPSPSLHRDYSLSVEEILDVPPLQTVKATTRASDLGSGAGPSAQSDLETSPQSFTRRRKKKGARCDVSQPWGCSEVQSMVTEEMLGLWHSQYQVSPRVRFIVPDTIERADCSLTRCVAVNQAMLEPRVRLPFPRPVKDFLKAWGVAPI